MPDYRVALLRHLGFPVTKENLRFLTAWQAREGGATHNNATFNWLNTTRGSQFPSINSVGVRAYPNFKTGIAYTAQTLRNGRYPDILAGLAAGNPYASPIADDLSTWVSGSPTKGLSYAAKVLGQKVPAGKKLAKAVEQGRTPVIPQTGSPYDPRQVLMNYFMASNAAIIAKTAQPSFASFAKEIAAGRREASTAANPATPDPSVTPATTTTAKGGFLQAPESWKPSHVTDGLGWGTYSASDIMAKAGTNVGAPEDGTIIRHGSAQGGESLWFRSDDGETYWLGHVESDIPNGTRVRRGQVIARISADHPRPHLHIDKR